ncbi:MAG: hypothetical protein ACHQT5_02255 [Candidatus Saccharimonadales bacterium]
MDSQHNPPSSKDPPSQQPPTTPEPSSDQNRELYRIHAIWFANLPPPGDELVIQEKTVHLIHKDLIEKNVKSLPVKDITHVAYHAIPGFATIEISASDSTQSLKIRGVPTEQALKAKRILEGLLLEKAGEVKVSEQLPPESRREELAKQAAAPLEASSTEES